jgi:dihydrofolate synthase/folylpolyglutamate synthase
VRAQDTGVALRGYQRRNFDLAAAAAQAMLGRPLEHSAIAHAAGRTRVPGRLQLVDREPLTIYDGAHNPSGVEALADALVGADGVVGDRPLVAVLSVLDDKDAAAMLRALAPHCAALVVTASANPRALSPATLASLAAQLSGPPTEIVPDPRAAVERARELAGPGGAVVATGSIYLVADLLRPAGARRTSAL